MRIAKSFLAYLLVFILSTGCSKNTPYKESFILMDTFVDIAIRGSSSYRVKEKSIENSRLIMEELEKKFNYFNKKSELSKINNLKIGERLRLSDEMFEVLKIAKNLFKKSQGAFSVSLRSPDGWALDDKDKSITFTEKDIKINLGGVAKGYIVDKGAEELKKQGAYNAIINAGGDMRCLGNGLGRGWNVGVRDPENPGKIIASFVVTDKALATSGSYERSIKFDGKKAAHIIDPRTGKPVENALESVTVVADNCALSDGLATAVFVLGFKEGASLIEKIDNAECILVTKDREVYISDGLKGSTTLIPKSS